MLDSTSGIPSQDFPFAAQLAASATASTSAESASPATSSDRSLSLQLTVRDREVIEELKRTPEGPARNEYALTALRLGVLAMRHASGAIDAQAVQKQADALLARVDKLITENATSMTGKVTGALTEYFDPTNGRLTERLNRLIAGDGDLSRLLNTHLQGDASTIAKTLAGHIGAESPLMKLLSPEQKQGLLSRMGESFEKTMKAQEEAIGSLFSLDDPESCLSRTIHQLKGANGTLREDLAKDLKTVKTEFSLDNPDGALARLVKQVTEAKDSMLKEFSSDNAESAMSRLNRQLTETNDKIKGSLTLDDPKSPLAVLKSEVQKQVRDLTEENQKFFTELRAAMAALQARKQEAAKGTQHGLEFEQAAGLLLAKIAHDAGDVSEDTGNTVGNIQRSKVGDHVITLGPDCIAANARIVFESKQAEKFTQAMAIRELGDAMANRSAQFGVFIFSRKSAPEGLPPIKRHGDNKVVCIWDPEDPLTDVYVHCSVAIAKALVVRQKAADERDGKALAEVERHVTSLLQSAEKMQEVLTWTETIQTNAGKILGRVNQIADDLTRRAQRLQTLTQDLRQAGDANA